MKCGASYHSVLAMGFSCDQRQPGSKVAFPTQPPPMLTKSMWPRSNFRVSAGFRCPHACPTWFQLLARTPQAVRLAFARTNAAR